MTYDPITVEHEFSVMFGDEMFEGACLLDGDASEGNFEVRCIEYDDFDGDRVPPYTDRFREELAKLIHASKAATDAWDYACEDYMRGD